MTSEQESCKTDKPQYCGECRYIQFIDKLVKDNYIDLEFESEKWYCTQARLKVYKEEKACPWGLKEDKPKK